MEKPILFSGEMVRAILEGRKTQTRRVIKNNYKKSLFHLRKDCILIIHTPIQFNNERVSNGKLNIETDSCISKRRLYGWERWEDILADEIQRIWQKGVRGLVCIERAPGEKEIFNCKLMSYEQEGYEICSQIGLYGISWNAKDYINASEAFGRRSNKQQARESCMGNTRRELAGQEGSWERNRTRKTSNEQIDERRETSYSMGCRKGIGFSKSYCKDIGYVTIRYSEHIKYSIGMKLWVRETWGIGTRPHPFHGWVDGIEYKADCAYLEGCDDLPLSEIPEGVEYDKYEGKGWKPSIHMPRWASRITLEVKEIRVERLQDISEDDSEKEGVMPYTAPAEMPAYKPAFADLWDKINYDRGYGWDVNPWVWVVSFERI